MLGEEIKNVLFWSLQNYFGFKVSISMKIKLIYIAF